MLLTYYFLLPRDANHVIVCLQFIVVKICSLILYIVTVCLTVDCP